VGHIATLVLRQIAYATLVISGLTWLAARLSRQRSLILAYHGVHDGVADPRLNFDGMHVRARRFARQMRYVARRYEVTTLDGLLDGGPFAGRSRPRAVITLDDGYRNVQRVAQPILRALGLPATVFVPTDFALRACGFWWDRLRVMVAATERPHVAPAADGAGRRGLPPWASRSSQACTASARYTSAPASMRASVAIASRTNSRVRSSREISRSRASSMTSCGARPVCRASRAMRIFRRCGNFRVVLSAMVSPW